MSLREVLVEATRKGANDGAWPGDWQVPPVARIRKHDGCKSLIDERIKPQRSDASKSKIVDDEGQRYELIMAWWNAIGERPKAPSQRILAGFANKRFEALQFVPQLAAGQRGSIGMSGDWMHGSITAG